MDSSRKAPLVPKALIFPFIIITSLFFLWGIANDLTNPMVSAFKKVMPELSNFEAALVQFAFYGGYATMAIPAALFIRRFSYKSGIIVGLLLYAVGAFLFYPAAEYEVFGYFLASLYILTFGLAFLETTANPFILAMGEEQTATRRLNLSQAFNPMGSLLGMLVAQLLVIQSLQSDDYSAEAYAALEATTKATIRENDLGIISYPYLLLGGLVLVILVIVALTKFPSIREHATLTLKDSFRKLVINKRYLGGVLGIAFTVGCQIMCWTFVFHYVDHLNASRGADEQLVATWYNMAAMISFLTGRWISTYLLRYFQPGRLLMYYAVAGVILATGAILLPGIVGLYCLVGVSLAMSTMFPTIYGIALDGMGDEAKLGSAGLVMAIVGGALLPPLQAAMLDLGGDGLDDIQLLGFLPEIRFSFILPWLCLVGVAYYGYSSIKKQFLNT